ncbi:hypothetical protein LR48_Vigan10g016200 [Vigna angularis]|uniref:Uncharacterized protein n=1 Tax=Phaseolus angularis TaxID=3914 RepID=A0A0L9VGS1_PHAAN|nr:hypothetical protein LR48_Vigan10g016200 [Vigna angularis]
MVPPPRGAEASAAGGRTRIWSGGDVRLKCERVAVITRLTTARRRRCGDSRGDDRDVISQPIITSTY